MGQLLRFQDFENPDHIDGAETAASDATLTYADGFAAGQEEATKAQGRLDLAILDALEASAFSYAEARRDLLLQLDPLMKIIAAKLVPQALQAGFMPRVLDALTEAVSAQLAEKPLLRVHPDQLPAFRALLDQHGFASVTVLADPGLGPDTVQIKSDVAETALDTARLIAQMQDAFAGYAHQIEELEEHG